MGSLSDDQIRGMLAQSWCDTTGPTDRKKAAVRVRVARKYRSSEFQIFRTAHGIGIFSPQVLARDPRAVRRRASRVSRLSALRGGRGNHVETHCKGVPFQSSNRRAPALQRINALSTGKDKEGGPMRRARVGSKVGRDSYALLLFIPRLSAGRQYRLSSRRKTRRLRGLPVAFNSAAAFSLRSLRAAVLPSQQDSVSPAKQSTYGRTGPKSRTSSSLSKSTHCFFFHTNDVPGFHRWNRIVF